MDRVVVGVLMMTPTVVEVLGGCLTVLQEGLIGAGVAVQTSPSFAGGAGDGYEPADGTNPGGYGGGGGGGYVGGGGGGGYSGGGGGANSNDSSGGGGGSYIIATSNGQSTTDQTITVTAAGGGSVTFRNA